jgi:hypothetical protein
VDLLLWIRCRRIGTGFDSAGKDWQDLVVCGLDEGDADRTCISGHRDQTGGNRVDRYDQPFRG